MIWFAIGLVPIGCTQSEAPPSIVPTATYRLVAQNLRPLDTSRNRYVLWLRTQTKPGNDTAWLAIPLTNWTKSKNGDVLTFSGKLPQSAATDSLGRALLSIEPLANLGNPTSILLAGSISNSFAALSTDSSAIKDYSNAQGSVLFTTKSIDTNRAKNEFYLMRFVNGVAQSSITDLPIAKAGWAYGLWVLDSSFFPPHQFFYGSFLEPNGPSVGAGVDSNSSSGTYPFPGGYNPAPLTDGAARIVVTLEPTSNLHPKHPLVPSPIEIMTAPLHDIISLGDTTRFENIWDANVPTGTLTITH
ncbi:MAG: hypothetical protein Q8922_10040 [Bacteroidota bacterium]|nr:hypothetical protein [Bacteroidota bacterium]